MVLVNIDLVRIPSEVSEAIRDCDSCEIQRKPRVWICDYHSGYWAGFEDARRRGSEATP
jgi:hypothetical protein